MYDMCSSCFLPENPWVPALGCNDAAASPSTHTLAHPHISTQVHPHTRIHTHSMAPLHTHTHTAPQTLRPEAVSASARFRRSHTHTHTHTRARARTHTRATVPGAQRSFGLCPFPFLAVGTHHCAHLRRAADMGECVAVEGRPPSAHHLLLWHLLAQALAMATQSYPPPHTHTRAHTHTCTHHTLSATLVPCHTACHTA